MPCLLQSVASAVEREGLNDRTPASHCFTTSVLDAVKAISRAGDQEKGTLLESRWRKGDITGPVAK